MKTILTIGGDTWTDLSSSPNDTQVWKITDEGYKQIEEGSKPTMIEDEHILDVALLEDEEVKTLFQTSTLDDHMHTFSIGRKEMHELASICNDIKHSLSCDVAFDSGVPCRVCRFELVELMISYLKIHGFLFTQKELIDFYKSKTIEERQTLLSNETKMDE